MSWETSLVFLNLGIALYTIGVALHEVWVNKSLAKLLDRERENYNLMVAKYERTIKDLEFTVYLYKITTGKAVNEIASQYLYMKLPDGKEVPVNVPTSITPFTPL